MNLSLTGFGAVVYKDREEFISNPTEFPNVVDTTFKVKEVQEPVVKASIIVPEGISSLPVSRESREIFHHQITLVI